MNRRSATAFVPLAVLIAVPSLAWYLPGPKQGAIEGRLSYHQFMLAIRSTAVGLPVRVVVHSSAACRRQRLFRLVSVWLAAGLATTVWEIVGFTWPFVSRATSLAALLRVIE